MFKASKWPVRQVPVPPVAPTEAVTAPDAAPPPTVPAEPIDGRSMRGLVVPLLAVIAVLLAILAVQGFRGGPATPKLDTPYQAVALANGSVFFGRLENAGSAFPVLRDVYYIRNVDAAGSKEFRSELVKRGSEWHEPDSMTLNARYIVLIEPVKPDSQLAKLIEAATAKK